MNKAKTIVSIAAVIFLLVVQPAIPLYVLLICGTVVWIDRENKELKKAKGNK